MSPSRPGRLPPAGIRRLTIWTAENPRDARGRRGEKKRGRVRNARFVKSGTIWERPTNAESGHRERFDAIIEDVMVRYRTTLEELAK